MSETYLEQNGYNQYLKQEYIYSPHYVSYSPRWFSGGGDNNVSIGCTVEDRDNRLLVVGIRKQYRNITSVKHNGTSMTLLATTVVSVNISEYLYYLVNPTIGYGTIKIVYDGASSTTAACASVFYGVNQTTPFTSYTSLRQNTSLLSGSLVTNGNELVVSFLGGVKSARYSIGYPGQIYMGRQTNSDSTIVNTGNMSIKYATGSLTTLSWDLPSSGLSGIITAAINPA